MAHTDQKYTVAVRPIGGKSKRIGVTRSGEVRWYKPGLRGRLSAEDIKAAHKHFTEKYGADGYKLTKTLIERHPHLEGDLDCNVDLLDALEGVGRRLSAKEGRKVVVTVRSGKRTLEEQTVLWNRYGPPRAARPNPNAPHVRGIAADCGINGRDIGDYPGARAAMKAEGLCLRVPNEDWHVERGTTWNA